MRWTLTVVLATIFAFAIPKTHAKTFDQVFIVCACQLSGWLIINCLLNVVCFHLLVEETIINNFLKISNCQGSANCIIPGDTGNYRTRR